jgi:hypothetical protein
MHHRHQRNEAVEIQEEEEEEVVVVEEETMV